MSNGTPDADSAAEKQKADLLLDLTQLTLDVIGVIEPTPIADGVNAAISVGRRDWLGAGLSAVSMLPYLGDLAKLGKIPRYVRTVNKAISLAEKDAGFAKQIRPVLIRLQRLLDDVPIQDLPGGLHGIHRRISIFLKGTPRLPGTIKKVMQTLPPKLRGAFVQAMKLPPIKNPRQLRKRPGAVDEDSLLAELAKKGFVQIKKGMHSPQKMTPSRRAVEDSDIYLRRIVGEDGKHYFEAIRVDRKFGGGTSRPYGKTREGFMPSPGARKSALSPGDVQRADKQFRRIHNTLGMTSRKVGRAAGGGRGLSEAGRTRMVNELQAGSKKGEFSHWHHERIPAIPETLAKYLSGPVKGTQKLDNMGQLVGTW